MTKDIIRAWHQLPIDEIEKHLIIIGDIHGDCANCKEIGLAYATVTKCPHCQTDFKYISPRNGSGTSDHRFHEVKRILAKRQDLTIIDYDDYKKLSGRNKAKKFFND